MVSYAQETQHEKIIRGLAVGIALVSLLSTLKWDLRVNHKVGKYNKEYLGSGSMKRYKTTAS